MPCKRPECGSSDAVTLYENPTNKSRFYKCYSCGQAYQMRGQTEDIDYLTPPPSPLQETIEDVQFETLPFTKPYRGITQDTLKHYKVLLTKNLDIVFPYGTYEGQVLAYKIKSPQNKMFNVKHLVTKGFQQSGLFGNSLFPAKGKYVTVTEGEEDAMSCYQMQGSRYACLSLKGGTNTVLTQEDKKYLESFETIIYCGDMDEPGKKAAQRFASSFDKNKVRIVTLSKGKDANDYLKVEDTLKPSYNELFIQEWWKAQSYTPEGLVQGRSTFDIFIKEEESKSIPYPWAGLQNLLHGIRTSELVVLTAGTGSGKSAVMRELAYHIFKALPNEKIGCMFLEESLKRTVKDLVGLELNTNLRLPENVVSKELKQNAWNNLFDNDRWIFWDHFGSNDIDSVCSQVRFIATNFGAKYIFLDHVSIIVSDGSHGDERKALDQIMTKLRTLVQELDICLFLVSHLRRSNDSVSHEEGGVTSLSQLRGSAGIGQLADSVIGLERNGQADNLVERNITTLRILKNRFTGETGPSCYIIWDRQTGRLKEIESLSEVHRLIALAEEMNPINEQGEVNVAI